MARYISNSQMDAISLAIDELSNVLNTCNNNEQGERLDNCIGELRQLQAKGIKSLRLAENRAVVKIADEIVKQSNYGI